MNPTGFAKWVQNLVWILPLGFMIWFREYTLPLLFMLIIALLISALLKPLVNIIEMLVVKRWGSAIIVYVAVFVLAGWGINRLWPVLADQAVSFKEYITMDTLAQLKLKSETLLIGLLPQSLHVQVHEIFISLDTMMNDIWGLLVANIQTSLTQAGSLVLTVGSLLISTLFIIVFSFFFVLEGNRYKKAFIRMIPNAYFEMTLHILEKVTTSLGSYVRGQLLAAMAIGVLSILGLFILQAVTPIYIPYTILIGTIAGVANLIPFVGPVMGMIPAVVIYLLTDQTVPIEFMHIVLIIITFGCVQLLDNILVSPMIMSESVGLHPLAIILAVLLGGSIAGPVGMLFAVPILTMVKVIFKELIWGLKSYGYM
ncbi:MAG: AI-2E family transporter [Candidatus Marinimicrobia bacterium]|nr:AI-2E family transporter [Candidatus Neomarinimicrobiota bacterium]